MPNHTIYISAAITEQFDKEENKSGLINQLLAHHYGQVHTKAATTGHTYVAPAKPRPYAELPIVELGEKQEELDDFYANLILDTAAGRVADTELGEYIDSDPEMIKELKRRGQVR